MEKWRIVCEQGYAVGKSGERGDAVEPKLCDNNKGEGPHEGSDVPNTSSGVVLHWCWVVDVMCSVGSTASVTGPVPGGVSHPSFEVGGSCN
jgi:hypothetical protein